jgi:integrase
MRIAVAIVILQSAPLRIANLAGLRLDRHLVRPGGPRSLLQIDIPPHEVKNDQHLFHELPRRPTDLVDRYIRAAVLVPRDTAATGSCRQIYHIREPQKIPLVMSPDETRRLLAVASNLKVRTLLSLGYGCGLRAGEVVRLKVKHIDSAQKIIRVEQSKGRKDRNVILSPETLDLFANGGRRAARRPRADRDRSAAPLPRSRPAR